MTNENKTVLGTDLMLSEYLLGADLSTGKTGDLELVSKEMNLAQAILHRLRTIRGELSDLGHPDYGSNLYDLIGEPNNQTTRDRLKVIIRDTLLQEPRIKEITRIEVRARKLPLVGDTTRGKIDQEGFELGKMAMIEKKQLVRLMHQEDNNNSRQESVAHAAWASDPRSFLNSVDIDITVIPIVSHVPLNIVFPFYLEVM